MYSLFCLASFFVVGLFLLVLGWWNGSLLVCFIGWWVAFVFFLLDLVLVVGVLLVNLLFTVKGFQEEGSSRDQEEV